jgi:BirA family transcriptional regulator, biotin operon repressor / biotin---[acetyl-CoA-carboxylase] ligase
MADPAGQWHVPPGWTLTYLPATGSTNDDAKRAAAAGCADRTLVLTDQQWAGRGRLNRVWLAPRSSSLLFSVVLRRPLPPIVLVALCSIAVADAIHTTTGLDPRIKWPNDVMLGDRKVAGLLAEVVSQDNARATIIGIGVNVNLDPTAAGLPPTATSLSHATGRDWSRPTVLTAILARIDATYLLDNAAIARAVWPRWESLLWRREQQVRIDTSDDGFIGTVEGLGPTGALLVRTADGQLREVSVGDVLLP